MQHHSIQHPGIRSMQHNRMQIPRIRSMQHHSTQHPGIHGLPCGGEWQVVGMGEAGHCNKTYGIEHSSMHFILVH